MTARRLTRAGIVLLLLAAAPARGGLAAGDLVQNPGVRPTERTKSCDTAGCHEKEKYFKYLHGPAAIGACDACHSYADEKKHTFVLKKENGELCAFCHIGNITGKVVHKPVAEGNCLGCHNPHGGSDRGILRKEKMADLCADCHKDVTQQRKHLHGPVAAGSCAACHNAHRAEFPKLLVAQGRDLCAGCHEQMDKDLKAAKFVHKPAAVGGDCQQCHEVHASNYDMQLKAAPADLCVSCHEDVKKKVAEAPHKHSAVTSGAACLTCHTPHGGQLAGLVKDVPSKMCLSCHDKKIEPAKDGKGVPAGHVVASVAELGKETLNKHGPIRDGNCGGCHEVHGGAEHKLLAKAYPETFYTQFGAEKYDLCFSCHEKQLVQLAETKGLTGFRNGQQNLHYLHVNRDKGRTCRACHETHASAQPFHIREAVPFGNWSLPINFKASETGGSCAPGCHKAMGYDREKPVANPLKEQPTNSPSRPVSASVPGKGPGT